MKRLDSEVKTHEQAHKSAAMGLTTSAPKYETEKGPDGKEYVVAGEVSISFKETDDNKQNLEKAKTLKRAALAPSKPSSQDRAVAQKADTLIRKFEQKIIEEEKEEKENNI